MLNINQNFDLKAPVFNFDRDYFNSVEELNAYDTSNVPDHFVTNVAGMLYQFTDGKWLPMICTEYEDDTQHYVNLGCTNAYLEIDTQNDVPINLWLSGTSGQSALSSTVLNINSNDPVGGVSIEADYDGTGAGITVSGDNPSHTIVTNNQIICGDDSFKVDIYGDEGRIEINDAQGRRTNYSASGFSGQTKDNTASYSLNLPSKNTDTISLSLKSNSGDFTFDASNGLSINSLNTGYDIFTDIGDGSINLTSTSEGFNYSNTICPESISIQNRAGGPSFVISCLDSTEGAVISGIKSLTAFANPSATKVWATDGSTVDLSTKANASDLDAKANKSDVLLKKSTTGGYYIEANRHELGNGAFATNDMCTASADYSHAEGTSVSSGSASHAEGVSTEASGMGSHAEGVRNVIDKNAIHSVGIGEILERKNAEYIYVKNNDDGTAFVDDPKNGYKYLIGVGGYDGISTDNTTYKSVQEVIADLTARIEQLETKVKALEAANAPA